MKLYHNPASPFVRKIMVVIHELGLGPQIEIIAAAGHAIAPGTMPLDRNPLGKIPTLRRDDGPALYDSRVICRYLDDKVGGGLYPQARLWDVLTLEATADGMMDAAVLMVYESRVRPADKQFAPWVEAQWGKVARALDALEGGWTDHLAGPLDMSQIAVACALGYLDLRHDARTWREGRPKLAKWDAVFAQRPAMQATRPPPQ